MGFAAVGFCRSPLRALCLSQHPKHTAGGDGTEEQNHSSKVPLLPGSHKWRMVIAYDGTKFSGWQYQKSPPTIQCLVEDALTCVTKLDRKELCLVGASRTDTGVHAWGQVAHFSTPFTYDSLDSLHAAMNGLLPPEIRVREISPAHPEFHARFSAKGKTYHYKIYNNPVMDPFQRCYAYHSVYKLNPEAIREAAKCFIGRHDFTSFANASHNDRVPNPVKEIFRFDITEMDDILQLEVEGTGFLYRQVRNMVALLIQVGREAQPADVVPKILSARDRRALAKVALSAPPHGLCLMSVNYDNELLMPHVNCPITSFGRNHTVLFFVGGPQARAMAFAAASQRSLLKGCQCSRAATCGIGAFALRLQLDVHGFLVFFLFPSLE